MLRNIFVGTIIAVGLLASLRGPFYALLFYLWYAYFRPDGWLHSNWVSGIRLSLVAGAFALFMAVIRIDDLKFRLTPGLILILLALVHTFVSANDSIAPNWSWAWWVEFSKVLIIGVLMIVVVNTPDRLRTATLVIVLSLGFEAVKQGWVQLIVNPGGANSNEHFVLGDNNGVAVGMFMLAPLAGALVATSSTVWERRAHAFFLAGLVLRGLSTYSRGGFLTAVAVGLFSTARARHRFRVMLGAAVLATIVLSVMPQAFWDRMGTITAGDEERDSSSSGRLYFWQLATEMARDNPLTGVGFNAFSRAFDTYDTTGGLYGEGRAVHSTWFGLLAENGYPGLVVFVALMIVSFLNARLAARVPLHLPGGAVVSALGRGVQGSLIAFLIGGSFVNGMYMELIWHLFCLSIALRQVAAELASAQDLGAMPCAHHEPDRVSGPSYCSPAR
jgi:probable O-glycosylation ligase (exosortase A-associated)